MTVGELISELRGYDDVLDVRIMVDADPGYWATVTGIRSAKDAPAHWPTPPVEDVVEILWE